MYDRKESAAMKAILFDLGRVLVDYDHQRTVTAVTDCCSSEPEAITAFMQATADDFGVGTLSAEEFHTRLAQELGYNQSFPDFVQTYASGLRRNEEALAYAIALQRRSNVTVGIISNTNAAHVYWLDEHLPELIAFDLVMMSNEVAMLKPDAAIFELALELLNVYPKQAIFIDDLAVNVEAARALGLAGIVHSDWAKTRPQLESWLEQ